MLLIEGLLLLLAACIVAGIVRKLRGGTFLPPPSPLGGDHHVKDKTGRWWRFDVNNPDTIEPVFRQKQKRRSDSVRTLPPPDSNQGKEIDL
jgi:hypothetical protein